MRHGSEMRDGPGKTRSAWIVAALTAALAMGACAPDPDEGAYLDPDSVESTAGESVADPTATDTLAGHPSWTEADWQILAEKVRWGWAEGLDQASQAQAMARLGVTFVGTTYTPYTLEAEGPEHLVINLRELDCVTFIESMYALARFVRQAPRDALDDRSRAIALYEEYLKDVRYRGGGLEGYPSRLHYFTDWIHDNEEMGLVRELTRELDGVRDTEPIDFMSTHVDAYRQLSESVNLEAIRATEARLSEMPRYYIPQERVAEVAGEIQDGDIIAAKSSVEGLDVAHTGLALWQDGSLHLLHAPLVGEDVQISEVPLAERILGIDGQDGIKVARPLDPPPARGAAPRPTDGGPEG